MDYDVRIGVLNVLLWWGEYWRQIFVLCVRKTGKWN